MARITTRFLREGRGLPPELVDERDRIEAIAKSYGLDFFETIFEMCSYEEINMVAAYGGFPTRYPHWRFGMDFLQTNKSYEYGLSKIYEMVINNDPSYAYLMDCNLMVDQKLVMAHVFGHVDFFKNNAWFAHTNRKMLDDMANHATRIRAMIERHGEAEVEQFIDRALSIDNLIDPFLPHIQRSREFNEADIEAAEDESTVHRIPTRPYMDRHINPPDFLADQRKRKDEDVQRMRAFPESPVRDVLGFVARHATMPRWQQEILEIIRDEAMYFAPQAQTKIMNEGWATYWHTHLMTRHILSDHEVVDYCDHHSGTVAQQPGRLNPYKLGVELWRHIERRWDKGQHGKAWTETEDPAARRAWDTSAGDGRAKLFEVRRTHNDITFLDTFLSEDFCREQGFFTTRRDSKTNEWVIDSTEFADVKKGLLAQLASRGTPRVFVVDANANNRGELRLWHDFEGHDLQLDVSSDTLLNLAALWGRPVHVDTHLDGKPIRLTHDGLSLTRAERAEDPT